jgi:hypothetical protein
MTTTGDFVKGFLIVWCVAFLFLIIEFLIMGQATLAGFIVLGFMIPLSVLVYIYAKNKNN